MLIQRVLIYRQWYITVMRPEAPSCLPELGTCINIVTRATGLSHCWSVDIWKNGALFWYKNFINGGREGNCKTETIAVDEHVSVFVSTNRTLLSWVKKGKTKIPYTNKTWWCLENKEWKKIEFAERGGGGSLINLKRYTKSNKNNFKREGNK